MGKHTFIRVLLNISLLGFAIIGGICHVSSVYSKAFSNTLGWTEPINLSHSGSTSNPQLIIDSAGHFHAIWKNAFNEYLATDSDDGMNWSEPVSVNFPFSTRDSSPVLIPDTRGFIHAFWTDSTNALLYSRVFARQFSRGASWEETKGLAKSATDFDVVYDERGIIHLAYIRILSTTISPSGVYYQRSSDNGAHWANSQLLYQSQYFRSLVSEEANVKLSTAGDDNVYVVWDNRFLKRIFLTKSMNGGKSWTEPIVFKGPEIENGASIPFGINISANGDNVLIIWQFGQPAANCDQYSQWSTDNGNSWNTPLLIFQSQYSCSPESKMFVNQDGLIFLMTNMEAQSILLAWNGSQWSDRQNILSSFTDPDTYNSIIYRGHQAIIVGNTQLYVIGYDNGGIGDTWLTSRSLESISDWFPKSSNWSKSEVIFTTPSEISSISIVVDEKNQFHVLWIQSGQYNNKKTYSINYSKWDGNLWTQPLTIYSAPQGDISQLDTAVDKEHLLVVWSEGLNDQILYSWSNTDTGLFTTEWATPVQLSTTRFTGKSPRLLVDNAGIVYVAYSKPINEDRGIYIVKSMDDGNSWSDPFQIFNAEAAGWDIADSPELATDQNGSVNLVWARKSFPEAGQLLALYTSQSGDQGSTWSIPNVVAEGDLTRSQITGIHSSSLHRIWQAVDISTRLVNWHQYSLDGGATWSLPTSITDPEDYVGSPIVTTDTAGRLYLFQPIQVSPQMTGITYRLWDTDRWLVEDRIIFGDTNSFIPGSLAAAISPSGRLILVYLGKVTDATAGSINYTLSFVSQTVEIPVNTQTPEPPISSEPTKTPVANTTPSESQTPAIMPTQNQAGSSGSSQASTNNTWTGLILGSGLALGIVAVFIIYNVIVNKHRKSS